MKNFVKRKFESNIRQGKLAEISDLLINYISIIEREAFKHVSVDTLYKILKSLNVSMKELIENNRQEK